MGLFLHCQPPAPVIYETVTILERVEMVYLNPSLFDLLSLCYALHESYWHFRLWSCTGGKENILFPTPFKVFCMEPLMGIVDRQEEDHVLHIFFMKFKFISVLLFSAHRVSRAELYLSRIVFFLYLYLLTSEACGSFSRHETVLMADLYSKMDSKLVVRALCVEDYITRVRVFSQFLRFGYLLPALKVYSSCMMPMGIIMGTQILIEVFLILKMLLWVGYLRWKFRIVPPGLWNVRNVNWVNNNFFFISVVCSMLQWDTASWNSVVLQVLKDYQAEKSREGVSRRHENCLWSSLRVEICIKTVEANTQLNCTGWECCWLFTGIHDMGLHPLVGIFSDQMKISKGSTLSSFLTDNSGNTLVMIFLYAGWISPTVQGGEIFCVAFSFHMFFLALSFNNTTLPPRAPNSFAKFLEFARLLVFDRGKTTTMYEHNITQLISGLGVEVKSFTGKVFCCGARYLLIMIPIIHMLAWLEYWSWKFKLVYIVLWSAKTVSWITSSPSILLLLSCCSICCNYPGSSLVYGGS